MELINEITTFCIFAVLLPRYLSPESHSREIIHRLFSSSRSIVKRMSDHDLLRLKIALPSWVFTVCGQKLFHYCLMLHLEPPSPSLPPLRVPTPPYSVIWVVKWFRFCSEKSHCITNVGSNKQELLTSKSKYFLTENQFLLQTMRHREEGGGGGGGRLVNVDSKKKLYAKISFTVFWSTEMVNNCAH